MRRLTAEWPSWQPEYRAEALTPMISGTIKLVKSAALEKEESPEETLEDILDSLNENVKSQILEELSDLDPSLFESVIGELLGKIGYGDVQVTGRSGDGGIDGTCSTDALGLYKLHFQAKRWKNQVAAKDIRDFIGGIQTSRGEYGIFVTTSDFTRDAIETAKKSGKVKLVNGEDLAGLMVKYGLGVSKTSVAIAKIDRDYFEGL
jgi:restriction system protein